MSSTGSGIEVGTHWRKSRGVDRDEVVRLTEIRRDEVVGVVLDASGSADTLLGRSVTRYISYQTLLRSWERTVKPR